MVASFKRGSPQVTYRLCAQPRVMSSPFCPLMLSGNCQEKEDEEAQPTKKRRRKWKKRAKTRAHAQDRLLTCQGVNLEL